MPTPIPDLSIVIPYYKSWSTYSSFALRLSKFKAVEVGQVEVILVDNSGREGIQQMGERIQTVIAHPASRGRARATGASRATGRHILMIDDSCEFDEPVLEEVLRKCRDESPSVAQLRVLHVTDVPPSTLTRSLLVSSPLMEIPSGSTIPSPLLNTAGLVIDRILLESMGGFDPAFKRAEDREFGLRLSKQAEEMLVWPLIVRKRVEHRSSFQIWTTLWQDQWYLTIARILHLGMANALALGSKNLRQVGWRNGLLFFMRSQQFAFESARLKIAVWMTFATLSAIVLRLYKEFSTESSSYSRKASPNSP